MAAMRIPDIKLLEAGPAPGVTVREASRLWLASRVDVSEGTRATYGVNLGRILGKLAPIELEELAPADVAGLVSHLTGEGLARESIRKTLSTLAQVLDFSKVVPNPARDSDVKLPPADTEEVDPPTAAHVLAVHWILPKQYRLPLLVLDATGMRIGEFAGGRWRDLDEQAGNWRVRKQLAKTRNARWVPIPEVLLEAIAGLVPREDRDRDAQVFDGFGADRFRTAVAKACKACGVPDFSPHDLRHRRATLWHLGGVPAAQAAAWLGHSAQEHLKTYAHASLDDRTEINYATVLEREAARM
jgi:integrase